MIVMLFLATAQNTRELKFHDWERRMSKGEAKMKLVFHFKNGNCLIDVPVQGVKN